MTIMDRMWLVAGTVLPAMFICWVTVFWVRRRAPGWGLVDQPASRKVHTSPTPLGGGLGIWSGVIFSFLLGYILFQFIMAQSETPSWVPEFVRLHLVGLEARLGELVLLLVGASLLMVLGLFDDFRGLDWRLRLGMQFLITTICLVWQGWQLTIFIDLPVLTIGLSVIWVVALINSFNMLDNMDGASAGVAAIAAAILAAFLLLPGNGGSGAQVFVAGFLLVLVGSLLGFLFHNRPPAKIFMGDAGSYFVGFCIGITTLLATYASHELPGKHTILAPLCVMAVPFYDMLTVIWIRCREGRSPFQADRSHFSHRLVELGLTRGQAVLTIYLTTATCGLGALLLHHVDSVGAAVILLMICCVLSLIAILETTARRKLKS
ncbi:MAG: MraY family glycosyltransferase [Pirellulaceae bacterium]